jgi:hypothetical protein
VCSSDLNYYAPGTIEMTESREFPVLPMTAIDEITYRTPDALFNGEAVASVIQSCMPNIKNAWAVPAVDFETILVGIRIASYGPEMNFDSTCPACLTATEHAIDLRIILDQIGSADYSKELQYEDLTLFFKPLTYRDLNDNNRFQFENQKTAQFLQGEDVTDEKKMEIISQTIMKITQLTIKALTNSIKAIKTPTTLVSEQNFIEDFLNNCDRKLFKKIEETVTELKASTEIKPLQIKCPHCQHEYQQTLTLDMANFFADAS